MTSTLIGFIILQKQKLKYFLKLSGRDAYYTNYITFELLFLGMILVNCARIHFIIARVVVITLIEIPTLKTNFEVNNVYNVLKLKDCASGAVVLAT